MTTRVAIFDNSTSPANTIVTTEKARVCFSVYLDPAEDWAYIFEGSIPSPSTILPYVYRLQPGELIFFSAMEGHDVTKPWYIISSAAGSHEARVYEELLDASIMDKLLAAGIDSTQGLPLLLLGVLVAGK